MFFHFAVQFLCLKVCVYGGSAVPGGGGGGVTWQPSPRGWRGTVFPGVGQDKGGGDIWNRLLQTYFLLMHVVQVRSSSSMQAATSSRSSHHLAATRSTSTSSHHHRHRNYQPPAATGRSPDSHANLRACIGSQWSAFISRSTAVQDSRRSSMWQTEGRVQG